MSVVTHNNLSAAEVVRTFIRNDFGHISKSAVVMIESIREMYGENTPITTTAARVDGPMVTEPLYLVAVVTSSGGGWHLVTIASLEQEGG